MTWILSLAHAHPVVAYFSIGAVLSVALGTWSAWTFDGELDGFCLFLCGVMVFAWPIMVIGAVLAIPVVLLEAFWGWCDLMGFKPITWIFAWPWKLWVLSDGWRSRRKAGKASEDGEAQS